MEKFSFMKEVSTFYDKFAEKLNKLDNLNYSVSYASTVYDGEKVQIITPYNLQQSYRQADLAFNGFFGMLKFLVTSPKAVEAMLINSGKATPNIYVASKEEDLKIDKYIEKLALGDSLMLATAEIIANDKQMITTVSLFVIPTALSTSDTQDYGLLN